MGRRITAFLLVHLCFTCFLLGDEGKLQAVREAARDSCATAPQNQAPQNSDDESSAKNWFLDKLWEQCWAAPFTVPQLLLNDDLEVNGYFLPYPYADHVRGLVRIDSNDEYHFHRQTTEPDVFADTKSWMVRLAIEESNDFDGLNRVNGQLLLDTSTRFGLQTSWIYLNENLAGGKSDEMLIGDANVVYRFAQNKWVQMRSGLGIRFSSDRHDTHYGFNFTYGADFFPIKPLIVSTVLDGGTLGEAGVIHARGTAGISYHYWELYGGYDFLRIGSTNLQGPVIGLRCWF